MVVLFSIAASVQRIEVMSGCLSREFCTLECRAKPVGGEIFAPRVAEECLGVSGRKQMLLAL